MVASIMCPQWRLPVCVLQLPIDGIGGWDRVILSTRRLNDRFEIHAVNPSDEITHGMAAAAWVAL